MIEIKNLKKSYSSPVYDNFSLSFEEGKITCILGESGCGKTTLLNCIAGLTDYSGEITQLDCAYIFQTPRLVPNLTVFQNLELVCRDEGNISAMLEKVRLSDKAQDYPKNLSGGQAQRVAIARAFLYGGDIILMDEPFSSLDLKLKSEITELFFQIWSEDKRTALFVTHDVDEAISVAHRCIVIRSGKVVFDFIPDTSAPRRTENEVKLRHKLIDALIGN